MTPSTPPLVDVIAAALAGHQAQIHTDEGDQWSPPEEDCTCSCGEEIGGWVATGSDWEWPDWTKDHAAHQARAVLAAISEAGAVEWATEHVAQGSRTIEIHPCDSEADAQGAIAYYGGLILSRITGPWERAE